MNKQLILEKYIKVAVRKALKEQEEQQKRAEKALYLIYRFPGLKKLMEDLMSPVFGRFIGHIEIVAPKPTTFDVKLINGQDFSIIYIGKGNFTVKISGKKYNPNNLGELERASQSIADLLQLNYAPEEGKEQQSSSEAGIKSDLEKGAKEAPPAEETPAEEETPPPVAESLKKKVKSLNEIFMSLLNEGQDEEDLVDIFKMLGDTKVLTKTEIFDKLAQFTLNYYKDKPGMQDLIKVFPYYVNNVSDWRQYVPENEKKDNRGKEVEVFLKNYAIAQGVENSELLSGGRGKDVKIGKATVESKSDAGKTINTKLQTTYYSSDVYYAFVNNVAGKDVEVRIVAGDLLRKLSFGEALDEKANDFEIKLEKQIEDGLKTLDFVNLIKTALVQGPTERTTNFKIGNRLKVRFVMYFEPAYGKEKEPKKDKDSIAEDYNEE